MNSHQRRILKRAYQAGIASVGSPSVPQKQRQALKEPESKALKRTRVANTWLWKLLLGLATLSGIGFVIWPRIGVEPYASLNPQNPFAQLFYLENKSPYPIEDVFPQCVAVDVSINDIHGRAFSVMDLMGATHQLSSGAKMNVTCRIDLLFEQPQTYQNLAIAVRATYKVPWIGWKRCTAVSFVGVHSVNGTYVWTYRGADSCPVPAAN